MLHVCVCGVCGVIDLYTHITNVNTLRADLPVHDLA